MQELVDEFNRLRNARTRGILSTSARVVLGSSVVRVFAKKTKRDLMLALGKVPVLDLPRLKGPPEFSVWFDEQVHRLAEALELKNNDRASVNPGLTWGHASKVAALYVRDVVLRSRLFTDKETTLIEPWLYVPIDSIIIERARKLGVRFGFTKIREIDTREKFYALQDALSAAAHHAGALRIWFDDNWGDREDQMPRCLVLAIASRPGGGHCHLRSRSKPRFEVRRQRTGRIRPEPVFCR
jgi:hypothetical protein